MARRNRHLPKTPEVCPVCGEDVPRGSLACPECGADHRSGWRDVDGDPADLPEEDFDYAGFVEQEFGSPVKPSGIKAVWWITAMILLFALLGIYFYSFR
ncbi:MAG: zinc ribbon domain-containing protein [Verrucomicrobiota bacterium]